jgi:acyl-CoA thioesterase-1
MRRRLRALLVAATALAASTAGVAAKDIKLVVLGDSLSAGYELPKNAAFPAQLETALRQRGHKVSVINASVSGDTTGAGLARLDWAVPKAVDGVIVELGANDALRGVAPEEAFANLDNIINSLHGRDIAVFLAGMRAPRNLGDEYVKAFDAIYPQLAERYGLPLYPFFMDGVILNPPLLLKDGLHPNPQGVKTIVERILPTVEDWLASFEDAPKP